MARFHLVWAMVLGVSVGGGACADWPTDPASPLILGNVQGVVWSGHSAVVTPDGATWVAWVDAQCDGALRIQRIDANGSTLPSGGLTVANLPSCNSTDLRLAGCPDGSVVACRLLDANNEIRVFRFSPDGEPMWGDGVTLTIGATIGGVGGFVGLSDGDVLIVWHDGGVVFVDRFDPSGNRVWNEPAATPANNAVNMRIFAVLPDTQGGAYVVWDAPGPYTRLIRVARFTGDGAAAWDEPRLIVPLEPGSSRHTDPAAVTDGAGGVWLAWTRGSDGPNLALPSFVQRIFPDGSVMFEGEGLRISLDATRQFNLALSADQSTGDAYLAWRDGITTQALRAQRITPAGERMFGDGGVTLAPIDIQTRFDGAWSAEHFSVVVTRFDPPEETPSVAAYLLDPTSALNGEAHAVSDATPAGRVRLAPTEDAVSVTWLRDGPSINDHVAAQRLNADGTLGAAPPNAADLNGDGFVNGADLAALLSNWGPCSGCPSTSCAADLNDSCAIDGADLAALLASWTG